MSSIEGLADETSLPVGREPAVAGRGPVEIPRYLSAHYWWAYVHPRAVKVPCRLIQCNDGDRRARENLHHDGRLALKVKDVMSEQIVSVAPDASVLDAVRLMLQHKISGLPVIDAAGVLQGVVTEGDFLRRTETGTQRKRARWIEFLMGPGRLATEYVHASGRKVDEIMTPDVYTVTEDAPLEQAVHLMERHRIKRVLVVRDGKVVGIVTRSNLMRPLARLALAARPVASSDAGIRESLLAELKKQPWAPVGLLDIVVQDGVVKLSGALTDEREREAIRVAAENIPGVKKVEDHLIWIEPNTGVIIEGPDD